MVRDDAGVGAELEHRLPRHLGKGTGGSGPIVGTPRIVLETNLYARSGSGGGTHLRLGHAHVSLAEQELAVEIADVDGVEVDHLDIFEAAQHQGLEQLATDAAGADHQDCVFWWESEIRSAGTRTTKTDNEEWTRGRYLTLGRLGELDIAHLGRHGDAAEDAPLGCEATTA